jgi:hypothetical protein
VNSFHIKRTRFSAHTGDPLFPGAHAIRALVSDASSSQT